MKQLHRKDLFGWSEFNPERNLDFNSVLWVRAGGNVLIDPLGGAKTIVVTNSDHCRDTFHIAKVTGASVYGPDCERENFPIACDHWLLDGEEPVPGLVAYQLNGSKTPGELALLLGQDTLVTGDLIRGHVAGELCLLPDAKLGNVAQAKQSVQRMAALPGITTVLVGDGWSVFNQGGEALRALAHSL
jgi:hypothetical protein